MKELSLNILDIAMNSVKAGSTLIKIDIRENQTELVILITDNGCGMTREFLESVTDPFCTTRTTRKVGLGIPFFKLMAEQTGGCLKIDSRSELEFPDSHGTKTEAHFNKTHIDCLPLGDVASSIVTLIQGSPTIDFEFTHVFEDAFQISLKTADLREVLGDVSLDTPEVVLWIKGYLEEQYKKAL